MHCAALILTLVLGQQGEYGRAEGRGVQVVDMGGGTFDLVLYEGGLPGAGWKRGGKRERVAGLTAEQVARRLEGYERVERKSPTLGRKPPKGAVVLFDGTTPEHFRGGRMTEDGLLMEGAISKRNFGGFRLHVEFMTPLMPEARGQGRGNSGCYLQGRYEVQILDSFGLEGRHNECGGIYSLRPPDLNMCLPPLSWQTYDIDFEAAVYAGEGRKTRNARVTVRHNGVVVHWDVPVPRPTTAAPISPGPGPGPVYFQNHGNPVRFRNVWLVEREPDTRLDWWREARFGMFVHWGLYAVPAGVWKGRKVGGVGEWIMHHGKIPAGEYASLVGKFNPVRFDAEKWARLAQRAGMKYLVITTKHHDGFALFDSRHTGYDIMATPFRRDVMKELAAACRKHGIRVGWYYSILDWYRGPKFRDVLEGHVDEILNNYGPIDVLWFDGQWIKEWTVDEGRALYERLRRKHPELIINDRVKGAGDYRTPEQHIPARGSPGEDRETCMTMNDTWGFKRHDHNWKSTEDLIDKLQDIACKGGNFLLNVGPTALGEIPQPSVERLEAMGDWLGKNGESIYGTRAGPLPHTTYRPGKIYLHRRDVDLSRLENKVTKRYRLSDDVAVLEIEGPPEVEPFFVRPDRHGTLTFLARDAVIKGRGARLERKAEDIPNIGFWADASDTVSWPYRVEKRGAYDVEMTYACDPSSTGAEIAIGKLRHTIESTGSWGRFVTKKLGRVELPQQGSLTVRPVRKPKHAVMNLRSVRLTPR